MKIHLMALAKRAENFSLRQYALINPASSIKMDDSVWQILEVFYDGATCRGCTQVHVHCLSIAMHTLQKGALQVVTTCHSLQAVHDRPWPLPTLPAAPVSGRRPLVGTHHPLNHQQCRRHLWELCTYRCWAPAATAALPAPSAQPCPPSHRGHVPFIVYDIQSKTHQSLNAFNKIEWLLLQILL